MDKYNVWGKQEELMPQAPGNEEAGEVLKRAWIIWAAMFLSLIVYGVICFLLADKLKSIAVEAFPLGAARSVVGVISAVIFVMIGNIRKFQMHARSIKQRVDMQEAGSRSLQMKYMSIMVISLVLSEFIAVLGIILFMLSADFLSLYIFIGASALTMLVNCPKAAEIRKIAEKMSG
jgi:hypothetical protein